MQLRTSTISSTLRIVVRTRSRVVSRSRTFLETESASTQVRLMLVWSSRASFVMGFSLDLRMAHERQKWKSERKRGARDNIYEVELSVDAFGLGQQHVQL